jgi:hypothetical protein
LDRGAALCLGIGPDGSCDDTRRVGHHFRPIQIYIVPESPMEIMTAHP